MTNPLDQVPQAIRYWVYIIASVVVLAVAAWQAAEGNVLVAIGTFAGSLVAAMSASNSSTNTIVTKKVKAHE